MGECTEGRECGADRWKALGTRDVEAAGRADEAASADKVRLCGPLQITNNLLLRPMKSPLKILSTELT